MNGINLDRKTIKILLVDDGKLIRQAIRLGLKQEQDLEIIGEAENGIVAIQQIKELDPDLVIIDLEMPGMNGIETITMIQDCFPQVKTLVFSSHEEREYIHQAIVAGANGYLLKGTPIEDLANAIRNINRGYFQLGSGLLGQLSFSSSQNNSSNNYSEIVKNDSQDISLTEVDINGRIERLISSKTGIVRDELIEMLGKKLHALRVKQKETSTKIKTIKKLFYFVVAIQIILFGLVLYF